MPAPQQFPADVFPSWEQAPPELQALDANCGPLSLWMVAKALGREFDTPAIVQACRFLPGEGVWPLRLALAFKELGFDVEYRSHSLRLPDDALCEEARANSIAILPPMTLQDLLAGPGITVISYDVIAGYGHFTPVLSMQNGSAYLPLDYEASVQAIEIIESQRKKADLETITVFP